MAVRLTRSGADIELAVTDDGRGFDVEAVRRTSSGLGLVSIEERARGIGADVYIVSDVGRGTMIRVHGPVDPGKSETTAIGDVPALGAIAASPAADEANKI
jgi:signal transduction histidine kinase